VNTTSAATPLALSRVKLFWALSRMTHGLLDMATPALGALLCLGAIPSPKVIILGIITAFAGYTSVYALNDIVDYRIDREKMKMGTARDATHDLDAVYVRHPMAQGLLKLQDGIFWAVSWALVALVGAYALNPVCALIFLAGCLLEVVYCLLLRVSCLRTIVSGAVKTSGALAAVFAVEPNPSPAFLISLFLWLFFWEIGGQNVPNDWVDLDEDTAMRARTVPVRFGTEGSLKVMIYSLAVAVFLSVCMFWTAPAAIGHSYVWGALFAGLLLLILPAYRLYKSKTVHHAGSLFNRSSYYPICMLVVVLLSLD